MSNCIYDSINDSIYDMAKNGVSVNLFKGLGIYGILCHIGRHYRALFYLPPHTYRWGV
jgi:hypothetical protein